MNDLDTQTLGKLADLIVGDDRSVTPKYRSSAQLDHLFADAGIDRKHDGSWRHTWAFNTLKELQPEALERLILRLADPKEYSGGRQAHTMALQFLNRILAIEGLQVTMHQMTPSLIPQEPCLIEDDLTNQGATLDVPDFARAGFNAEISELLSNRWFEAEAGFANGAYLSAMIMLGSVMETVLLHGLIRNQPLIVSMGIVIKDRNGNALPVHKWELNDMINVATRLGWIQQQMANYGHSLRQYRNLVHPELQLRTKIVPSSEDCRIAAIILQGIVRDIAAISGEGRADDK